MSNQYYTHGSFPSTGAAATSASMRAELDLVSAGFDKLPGLTGNANKFVVINSTATGLTTTDTLPVATVNDNAFTFQDEADNSRKFQFRADGISPGATRYFTMPDADTTLVGTDTTQTLTNKTLTSPVIGTIVNTGTLTLPTSTDTLVGRNTTDTLTNKTLTNPVISQIINTGTLVLPTTNDTLVGRATSDTLTNKTISGATNVLSNIANASLSNSAVTIGSSSLSLGGTLTALQGVSISGAVNTLTNIPNTALTNSGVTFNGTTVALGGSATIKASTTNALTIGNGLSGTSFDGGSAVTIAINTGVTADLSTAQTFSNKTISGAANTLTNIGNASLTNSAVTIGSTSISLGATATALAGLSSVTVTGDPTSALQLATKQYVDNVAQGLNVKASVAWSTTANISLLGLATQVGGEWPSALNAGDRILVKNQTVASQNGIYAASATGWSRTADADTWNELVSAFVFVSQGATMGDTGWVCTADPGGTLGTNNLPWSQFSGAGTYTAGTNLTLTGTQFALASSISGLTAVSTGALTSTGNTSLGTITSNLLFTDNTYDIGANGATRPRNLYLAGNAVLGTGSSSAQLTLNANTAGASSSQIVFQAAGVTKWALGGGNIGSGGVNDLAVYNYATSTNAFTITSAANNATFSGKAAFNGASILSGVTTKDSLAITAASGSQFILMGNQDAGGANKPLVLTSGNANLFIGYGDSWASATGGAVTNLFAFTPNGRLGVNNNSPSYTLDVAGDARISTKGYIGTNPLVNAVLSVGGTGTEATDLATARTTAAFLMTPYGSSAWALAMGSASGQIPYIQGIDATAANARNISLQPYGESVGIGTTTPAASSGLHVYGTRALVRPVIQAYNATTSAEPSLKLSSGTTTEYSAYWGVLGGTAASYEYFDNRTGTGDTYWQKSGSNKMALYANGGTPVLDVGMAGLNTANGMRLQVYNGMAFGGTLGQYAFGTIRQSTSSPYETVITANAYPANLGVSTGIWLRSGTSGGGGPANLAYFRSDGVNFINTTGNGASDLNIRYNDGSGSGSLSITASSTGGGGASYFLLGNSDSGGATGPAMIVSANRILQFGVGDSFTSRSGGNFTEFWRINSSGQLQKTLTGDLTAIQILGSYSGNPSLITMGQSASDGFINIYSAAGDATHLAGYSGDTSFFTSKVAVGYNGASLSNTKFMVNGNASFGDYSTSSGFTFVKAIKVDYSSNNGPTSFNIRLNGTSVGEYYAKIFLVGLDPYSDTGYTTYTAEVTGYLVSGIGTVISSAENPNNAFSFGTPSFAANYVNIAVTTNANTNYRFTLCAMVVSNGATDRAWSMSVV